MCRPALSALMLAVWLSPLCAQPLAQPADARRSPGPPRGVGSPGTDVSAGTARLRGRVFSADSSQPVRFAQVRLSAPALQVSRVVTTDSAGRFEFASLPAGRYVLVASKGGFVTLQFGQRRPFEPGTPVELSDGQVRGVEFPLPRGSVIAGRVTDDTGEPAAQAVVSAARYVYDRGGRRHIESTDVQDTTDDLGQFRLFGLMPGEYLVNASLAAPVGRTARSVGGEMREGYASTYYPGVPNAADATPVKVGLGQEVSAYFSLMAVRLTRVAGMVTDADGRPASGAQVSLFPATGDDDAAVGGAQTRADGSFSIAGVAPGEHVLHVRLEARGTSRETEMVSMPVAVIPGVELAGLAISTRPGATVAGTVVFEGKPESARDRLVVVPTATDPRNVSGLSGPQASGRVGPDARFTLGGLFGSVTFSLAGPTASLWTITSVTLNGRDVTDRPAPVDSAEPGVVRIVVSDRVTDVSGSVGDGRGAPRAEFVAVFLPVSLAAGVSPMRFVRTARPSAPGRFRVQGLPAGTYHVLALESLESGREWEPEFQAWAREHSTVVQVEGGRQTSVELKF